MKTLIFIHGGESFEKDEDYRKFLTGTYIDWQSEPWTPELKSSWKQEIAKKWYNEGNQVFMPVFPNKQSARYEEWRIVFDGILERLESQSEITFVGGSLGGCFLLKYFAEISVIAKNEAIQVSEKIEHRLVRTSQGQKRIRAIHLVAACQECGNFTSPTNYEFLQELGDRVHIWHAEDDPVVPFSVGQELAKILPQAQTHFFTPEKGYGHFYGLERFVELESILMKNPR